MPDLLSLSSDILEQQFGPTEITVLYQTGSLRVICSRVVSSGQVLELSLVNFVEAGVNEFSATHKSVLDGKSMGKAFRADGIKFMRREQAAYHYALPSNFTNWFSQDGEATMVAALIMVGPDQTAYAKILEVYSPAVKWPRLHGKPASKHLDELQLLSKLSGNNI
jgi:hypothetical protein